MTNHNFPRRLLDDAIDHAVRELMHADARPGFRRRVLERLHQPKARRSWWPSLLIPATAIAALLFAVVVLRQPSPAPATETAIVATPTPPAAPAPPDPLRTARVTPEGPPTMPPARRELPAFRFGPRTDRVRATSVVPVPERDLGGLPLDNAVSAPAPIAVAPLAGPAQIVVRPITFSRIDAASPSGSK